jgi:hypothetical protein
VVLCLWGERFSAPELHGHARSCGHVRSGHRRLLAGDSAADGIQFETCVLGSFHGSPYGLAYEGWHLNSALLDVEYNGSTLRKR